MEETFRISAGIVTYNSSQVVGDALTSLINSELPWPLDIYVVDNGSVDNTLSIIEENFPTVKIIRPQTNLGYGDGHNQVIPYLKSKYHFIVNHDITLSAHVLRDMVSYLEMQNDVVLLSPKVYFPDGREQYLPKELPSVRYLAGGFLEKLGKPFTTWRHKYTWADAIVDAPRDEYFATGCFMALRTEDYVAVGGFDPRYFMYMEDVDLGRELQKRGRIIYHPGISVEHHWGRESAKGGKGTIRHISSMIKYFNKWGWRF